MGPRVTNQKAYVMAVPAKWKAQYFKGGAWVSYAKHDNRETAYDEMIRLGDALTLQDVDRLIGNTTWGRSPTCDGCRLGGRLVAEVGQDSDYDSNTASLCRACLVAAIEELDRVGAAE